MREEVLKEYGTDTAAVIINQEAAKYLAYKHPVGKRVYNNSNDPGYFHIIGVIDDIYYESKHQKVHPMAIFHLDGFWKYLGFMSVRVNSSDYSKIIKEMENRWEKYSGGIPFTYSFFDEDYDNLYRNEMQSRKLFLAFSVLAIFIACLGLIGLASFIAQQKPKK